AADPALVPGYPAVDVLNIDRASLPDSLRVGSVRVYRVRAVSPTATTNQNIGGVRAVACGPGPVRAIDCDAQRAGPFQWELLLEGKDYYVDPSGVWFALAARLDQSPHLGMALQSDPTRFDQYNRLFPRARDPNQGTPLRDYFAVFPHLAPFADSARLAATERNDSLYRTPRLLLVTQAPPSVFALGVHASVSASSDRSQLSLNSFQIRDGSEKIYVGSRLLTRDADYS